MDSKSENHSCSLASEFTSPFYFYFIVLPRPWSFYNVGKEYYFLLLPFWVLGQGSCIKILYLMLVLCDTGAFLRKWSPEGVVKPEYFYAVFNKEWEVVENRIGQKGYKWSVMNWENLARSDFPNSFLCLLRRQMLLSSTCRVGICHITILLLALGKGQKVFPRFYDLF
jgi:hypothetical protein